MVASWLAAHRGHMPAHLWEARRVSWTPDVSASGWARVLGEIDGGLRPSGTLLVAEDPAGGIVGIGMISLRGAVAEIDALYVSTDRQREGIGSALIARLAAVVADVCTTVELSVLTANERARGFYEAIGGELVGSSTFDEGGTPIPSSIYRWRTADLLDPGSTATGG